MDNSIKENIEKITQSIFALSEQLTKNTASIDMMSGRLNTVENKLNENTEKIEQMSGHLNTVENKLDENTKSIENLSKQQKKLKRKFEITDAKLGQVQGERSTDREIRRLQQSFQVNGTQFHSSPTSSGNAFLESDENKTEQFSFL